MLTETTTEALRAHRACRDIWLRPTSHPPGRSSSQSLAEREQPLTRVDVIVVEANPI